MHCPEWRPAEPHSPPWWLFARDRNAPHRRSSLWAGWEALWVPVGLRSSPSHQWRSANLGSPGSGDMLPQNLCWVLKIIIFFKHIFLKLYILELIWIDYQKISFAHFGTLLKNGIPCPLCGSTPLQGGGTGGPGGSCEVGDVFHMSWNLYSRRVLSFVRLRFEFKKNTMIQNMDSFNVRIIGWWESEAGWCDPNMLTMFDTW